MAVLITRPAQSSNNLQIALEKTGIDYCWFPALQFEQKTSQALHEQYDAAVVVSPFAAEQALQQSPTFIQRIPNLYAVGAATAAVLTAAGATTVKFPEDAVNAEGLIALPDLQNIQGKKILLVKGEGGNPVISTTLRKRSAEVTEAILYCRAKNQNPQQVQQLKNWLEKQQLHCSVITSAEALKALLAVLNEAEVNRLLRLPLIVSSERIADIADSFGFKAVRIANSALAPCLVSAIKELESSSLSQ